MKELTFEAVKACKSEDEFWALLTEESGWAGPATHVSKGGGGVR